MYKAKVNTREFEVEESADGFTINGEPVALNMEILNDGSCHVLYKNKGYRAEVVKRDEESKTVTLKINNKVIAVTMKDKMDILLEKMGMSGASSSKVNSVKAPMPGLIIDLRVKAGDLVKAGDTLLILEAMKMENSIKSPGEGVVKVVKVKKGDGVEKGQILIEF